MEVFEIFLVVLLRLIGRPECHASRVEALFSVKCLVRAMWVWRSRSGHIDALQDRPSPGLLCRVQAQG
jgi:hypothetical protein